MPVPAVTITVLGSGTSVGVPMIGCTCDVCHSSDPRDNRTRPSVLISYDGHCVLIDTTPDFRFQALRLPIPRIDAVLYTHSHADHIMGLDDLRPFNYMQRQVIPIYAAEEHLRSIMTAFPYIFDDGPTQSSRPRIDPKVFTAGSRIDLFGLEFEVIRLAHGKGTSYGFRFGSAAYLTDHSEIPDESMARLEGLDVLFLDALRHNPHPTHSTVAQALLWVEKLQPKRTFLTHICHDLPHEKTELSLPANVRLAYDGLKIEVGASD
ncbi:MAG TPA: MBL fold metallo-hydrolase [Bryobacteraceae bacterium]|jgi:phosphoribosyl 1,2-cyclic phosphate phosphodiesterase